MKKLFKRYLLTFLCICLINPYLVYMDCKGENTVYAENIQIDKNIENTKNYILNEMKKSQDSYSPWMIIGLSRYDRNCLKGIDERYKKNLEERLKEKNGILEKRKYTEYSKQILALSSLGYDVKNISGYNLLKNLSDYDKVSFQGINGSIWALIALDSKDYEIPPLDVKGSQNKRQYLIADILNRQLEDGGFSLNAKSAKDKADPDITAMAVQALSKYKKEENIKNAIEKAVNCLSNMQNSDGGYETYGSETLESAAQVLVALTSVKINPQKDERFIKSGKSVVDNLLSYQNADGSFSHTKSDKKANLMSTEQAFYALVSYDRFLKNKSFIYDMNEKKADLKNYKKDTKSKTFSDIKDSKYKEEIEDLSQKNIISGVSNEKFEPQKNVTRAQFASMVAKALDLKSQGKLPFLDVKKDSWYYNSVLSCYKNKIIKGISDKEFSPEKMINLKEASVIIYNSAKYMKKDVNLENDSLKQFEKYSWAKEPLAYLSKIGGFSPDGENINTDENIDRQTAAHMIYCLLNR